MVYWFLSSFVSATLQVLLEKLTDLGIKAYGSVSELDDKLRELRRTLLVVESLISQAENKQLTDKAWQLMLQDLENVAYDADDIIDELAIEVSKVEGGKQNKLKDLVSKLIVSIHKRSSTLNVNAIQVKLDNLLKQIDRFCLVNQVQWRNLDITRSQMQTSSLTDESHVFGREIDENELVKMLEASEEPSRASNVSVVPIVGMISVGKTTLARLLYHYPSYNAPFDLKMWVCVSKDFDVVRLTRSIIEAAHGETTSHLLNLDSLHNKLKGILEKKKFLLVLDDLWNEKQNEWDLLLRPLKHGLKGSKIIVTTRSLVVSSLVGTTGAYHVKCLSDQDCWLLLKEEALGDINAIIDPELEKLGMSIAKKCQGFPLAAKSVGRLVCSQFHVDALISVMKRNIWGLTAVQDEVVPALRSSYDHLPSHLKQCFAYCSMFPQSYSFEKNKIVQMWIGEGFIIPDKERKTIEDMGNYYFHQLFLTSFFQMEGGKYKIHDAVHDLAQSFFGEKFCRMEDTNDAYINKDRRHLSLACEEIHPTTLEAPCMCKSLRTLLMLREYGTPIKELPFALFVKLGRMRVLDLSSTHIEELTDSIGNLKHLRFLDLSNTLLQWLPESTQELYVLQTLRLVNCMKLLYLPKGIGRLRSLRHLELSGNSQLTSMPAGIGKLTELQTVSEFIVGSKSGQLTELENMNNIRGSLCIKQLEKVSNPQEALAANLAKKKHLEKLVLQWNSVVDKCNNEHVLDKLIICAHDSPCDSLKELTLKRYGGRMFPKWVSDQHMFSRLTSIRFEECENCVLLPPLGELPKLKFLKIVGMHELMMVDELFLGAAGFQSLEILEFRDMPRLEGWVGVRSNHMKCLRELTVAECPHMDILPSLHYIRSLERLEVDDCPRLPSLTEEGLSRSMKSLIITECPMLENKYKRGGAEWMKIERIPSIELGYRKIR